MNDAAAAPDRPRSLTTPAGVTLAYRLWQPGAPRWILVLLHGLASNATRWTEFVSTTTLRDSWDLLRLDLRGFGESLHHGRIGGAEWAGDVARVLAAEGYARAVVAGHCLGANVAIEVALRHPDRVAGLVLIEPMFRPALTGVFRRITPLRPAVRLVAFLVLGLNALGLRRRRLASLDLAELDRRTRAAMAAGADEAVLTRKYASPLLDLATTSTAAYLQGLLAVTDPVPDLARVAVPTLALLSSGGAFTDPVITRRLLDTLPRCTVTELEAKHWIPTEQPQAMRQAIEAWCSTLPWPVP